MRSHLSLSAIVAASSATAIQQTIHVDSYGSASSSSSSASGAAGGGRYLHTESGEGDTTEVTVDGNGFVSFLDANKQVQVAPAYTEVKNSIWPLPQNVDCSSYDQLLL